ncbi:uncharacterized protein LOC109939078 [Rhincodon typus]|uniref:uncharacterized protein LOC109939078 n=1 Tax=Rhincodon typus TaxID=259920 RepID=UPI00202FED61|nr:uncharacterized protein LOC109939078 [Rhincodon typus]XP_048466904.1 uncharacterized protein LOC109939078 [Rhincodon typus]XP_048466905.1 uncharacterized protein LOC109939078 [Rhincodon typus]XP_048466906.1 uncharacterized protein LOC109939078 [Rhincodon typus]
MDIVQYESPQVQVFIRSGHQFLDKVRTFLANAVREGSLQQERARAHFKEILHIILFYGQIYRLKIEPEEILQESQNELSARYPDVFERCRTHLPTRPPFTVLLDAIVDVVGRNAEVVLQHLLLQVNDMEVTNADQNPCRNIFVSAVVTFCYFFDEDTQRQTDNYFGASVSCGDVTQRKIMIDILCCQKWHQDISWAACIGKVLNQNAFRFPPHVFSMAFHIYTQGQRTQANQRVDHDLVRLGNNPLFVIARNLMQFGSLAPRGPCQKCFTVFPNIIFHLLPPEGEHPDWEYGNCAEYESLSQLLYSDPQIAMKLQPNKFRIGRDQLMNEKYERLQENLEELEFRFGPIISYYSPL